MRSSGGSRELLLRRLGALLFDSPLARRLLTRRRSQLLDRALARGLEPELEPPLRWLITDELAPAEAGPVERIEEIRAALAARTRESAPSPGGRQIPLPRLALGSSVDRRFGTLLYLCGRAIKARNALELGSCVGIGTAYLGGAGSVRVVSLEASPERAAIARATAATAGADAEIVVGYFDDVLPGVLGEIPGGLDIAWIDGHHRRDATLRYFDQIKPELNPGAVVAFDDIRVSAEMLDAWRTLERADGFSDTLDLGPIGIGVWQGPGTVPRAHDLRGIYGRPRWLHVAGDRFRG